MSNGSSERLYYLMSVYTFESRLAGSFQDDLICILCHQLMIDASLTPCGCHYCYECIRGYLGDTAKYCQGITRNCNNVCITMVNDVRRDEEANHKIQQTEVICPNMSCSMGIKLDQMEQHLRSCKNEPKKCPYSTVGCNNNAKLEDDIGKHITDETILHTQLITSFTNNLKNEFNGLKKGFERCQLNLEQSREDSRLKISALEIDLNRLRQEVLDKDNRIQALEEAIINNKVNDEAARRNDHSTHSTRTKVNVENSIQTNSYLNNIEILSSEIVHIDKGLSSLRRTVANIKNDNGIYCKIDGFRVKKESDVVIISRDFYTWINGYKLRLEFRPGGTGSSRGTHVSVYFGINIGKYDDLLRWPFKNSVNVSILNQESKCVHKQRSFKYASTSSRLRNLFNKPINRNNIACGTSSFVSHDDLETTDGLIVNDSIIFMCTIGSP